MVILKASKFRCDATAIRSGTHLLREGGDHGANNFGLCGLGTRNHSGLVATRYPINYDVSDGCSSRAAGMISYHFQGLSQQGEEIF